MSRLRADTMPAVTVPPRLNGLPIATTHSPSRSLSESPNATDGQRLFRLHPQQGEVDLGVAPEDLGLEPRAVIEDDGHLVGVGDDVVVGHHDAGRIDDEARAQRIHPARRVRPVLIVVALLTAAAVLEEFVEELLERRARRQRRRRRAVAVVDALRGRDVDDRVDDLFGDIGDVVRAARLSRRGDERDRHHRGGSSASAPHGTTNGLTKSEDRVAESQPWAIGLLGKHSLESAPVRARAQERINNRIPDRVGFRRNGDSAATPAPATAPRGRTRR